MKVESKPALPGDAYTTMLYIMVALLLDGLVCNLLVRPVAQRHHYRHAAAAQPG